MSLDLRWGIIVNVLQWSPFEQIRYVNTVLLIFMDLMILMILQIMGFLCNYLFFLFKKYFNPAKVKQLFCVSVA